MHSLNHSILSSSLGQKIPVFFFSGIFGFFLKELSLNHENGSGFSDSYNVR